MSKCLVARLMELNLMYAVCCSGALKLMFHYHFWVHCGLG